MKYMVIETFKAGALSDVYARFHTQGRMLPDGLKYIDSWLEEDGNRCFQLMETEHAYLFEQWTTRWADLVDFEIIKLGQKP